MFQSVLHILFIYSHIIISDSNSVTANVIFLAKKVEKFIVLLS